VCVCVWVGVGVGGGYENGAQEDRDEAPTMIPHKRPE
jgi:hypothetical protein